MNLGRSTVRPRFLPHHKLKFFTCVTPFSCPPNQSNPIEQVLNHIKKKNKFKEATMVYMLRSIAIVQLLAWSSHAFVGVLRPPTFQARRSAAVVVQYSTSKRSSSNNNEDGASKEGKQSKDKQLPICLLATDQVLLPGETAKIWTEEERLIDDCVEHNYGVLAMGVVIEDDDGTNTVSGKASPGQGGTELLEIASLVEVKEVEEPDGDGMFVTVTCVGRVRLERLQQT